MSVTQTNSGGYGHREVLFRPTSDLPGVFETNFDYQLVWALGATPEGGAAPGECFATARRVEDGNLESWLNAWSATAMRVQGGAENSLRRGHTVSARDAFLRASTYWRTANFFTMHTDPRLYETWTRSRECFRQAAQLLDPPIEVLAIPYEGGTSLPGYFVKPVGEAKARPTIMIIGGGDTTAEELYFWGGGAAAARRGYNALLWEGPGQRGAIYSNSELTYRPDWEVPTKSVIDYALGRDDVDADHLAFLGHSFGGYFAPRAAAFDKRIKAVIANSLLPDVGPVLIAMMGVNPNEPYGADVDSKIDVKDPLNALFFGDFQWRCGMAGRPMHEFFDFLREFTLKGLEHDITCPLLSIGTSGEGGLIAQLGREFFDALSCSKAEVHTTEEEGANVHCQVNSPQVAHQREFDWLDETFRLVS